MNDKNICILVVDDEVPILNMLKLRLSRIGFTVDTAVNGKDAINKIDHNFYNVILTDIKMPGISGDQILDYLRNKVKKSTPIIGMSGTPWLLAESQFDAVLSKPCTMEETLAAISSTLS